eukprot:NODE_3887_length_878_cov_28.912117_g3734_i0.p1 GENE.NODE_3887_length_878_cov_28.912117_g3734_i0~~NODE_3887_length_878_cov_28.912117_g3734_i0.p1  ORF type:complete len:281 (+),score=66.36 NODE_3887_length_878_cov_28.912117_g3734_i0:73-843(+)
MADLSVLLKHFPSDPILVKDIVASVGLQAAPRVLQTVLSVDPHCARCNTLLAGDPVCRHCPNPASGISETMVLRFVACELNQPLCSTAIRVLANQPFLHSFPRICDRLNLEDMEPYELWHDRPLDAARTPKSLGLAEWSEVALRHKRPPLRHGHHFKQVASVKPKICDACGKRVWGLGPAHQCTLCDQHFHKGCIGSTPFPLCPASSFRIVFTDTHTPSEEWFPEDVPKTPPSVEINRPILPLEFPSGLVLESSLE